ncbi:hypothetical protein [Tautonia plasticadhaerens]|uniref:Caspase domain protein n=1 Tax=Tautonia plasticadhaerens TaxID=2527974 RepID=A0A518GY29_9BACT|nr:hypothetical protein [Tautonia plasticadhaerens]QDV33501.1 hypothetical protein ElP_13740 [Tautonia plasticadhaerens]
MPLHRSAAAALVIVALPAVAPGEDHFLVIGGGADPSTNQVSLEKNVAVFRALIGESYPTGAPIDVFFSDGDDPSPDLLYREPAGSLPRVNVLLARVLGQTDALGESYRSHSVDGVRGASSLENLRRWFRSTGGTLGSGDRLFIYATAHGGKGDEEDPRNTAIYLWGREELRVRELAGLIDGLPEGVGVVLVMVQCYSGGFAELAFSRDDRPSGPNRAGVCGFFATTHDRPAAGCTPDIDEEQYHEYSSYFWEAIRGRTRTGEPIGREPDLDGDGLVSLAEAHAYTLLESVTVDLSMKTSDAFLRHSSRLSTGVDDGLLSADSPCPDLLAEASIPDRAVIRGLSDSLGLTGDDRAGQARRLAEETRSEARRLDRSIRQARSRAVASGIGIRDDLIGRWPELKNRWNPAVTALLTTEAEAVVVFIEGHPGYDQFERRRLRLAELEELRLDQDRIWVRCRRLQHTLERVALEANLPRVADGEAVERFRRLIAAESASIGHRPEGATAALVTPGG